MKEAIAIITARGGSKRIPRKNLKQFCGKEILKYSIEAAWESACFSEIMVSTDDKEIRDIAITAGAKIPFMRSEKNSDDYTVTSDVLIEVLKNYQKQGDTFKYGFCIYPTAPFITGKKLRKAMQLLKEDKYDTVLPVVPFSFPPQRGIIIRDGYVNMREPENLNMRSQDLETVYHDCGQFYGFKVDVFLKSKKLIGNRTCPLFFNELEVQDIDNENDWKLAEMKYRYLQKMGD